MTPTQHPSSVPSTRTGAVARLRTIIVALVSLTVVVVSIKVSHAREVSAAANTGWQEGHAAATAELTAERDELAVQVELLRRDRDRIVAHRDDLQERLGDLHDGCDEVGDFAKDNEAVSTSTQGPGARAH